jgi:hypothetical protein
MAFHNIMDFLILQKNYDRYKQLDTMNFTMEAVYTDAHWTKKLFRWLNQSFNHFEIRTSNLLHCLKTRVNHQNCRSNDKQTH